MLVSLCGLDLDCFEVPLSVQRGEVGHYHIDLKEACPVERRPDAVRKCLAELLDAIADYEGREPIDHGKAVCRMVNNELELLKVTRTRKPPKE